MTAFTQCPRKAFLLNRGDPGAVKHDYDRILEERASSVRSRYLSTLECNLLPASVPADAGLPTTESPAGDLRANCDALLPATSKAPPGDAAVEPVLVVGTHSVTAEQKLRLAVAGHLVGETCGRRPESGILLGFDQKPRRIALEPLYSTIHSIIASIRALFAKTPSTTPPLILNQNCPTCPFREFCRNEAEQNDNLSLLDRATAKMLQKYHKKGIFTIHQLSFVFKPRRKRRRQTPATPVFNIELQALAIRASKTYVHEPPSVPEHAVEIYLDIEGIPDQEFDYLIGLVVKDRAELIEHSFWADSPEDEKQIFQQCLDIVEQYDDAPVFHYGSYEPRAFIRAGKRHGVNASTLVRRLVNVNSAVFGKVYFPARSNRLKDLGPLVGATWGSPEAGGLQSIVWRYGWELTVADDLKGKLIRYNLDDCRAVRLLVDELRNIGKAANSRGDIEFVDAPKRVSTDRGTEIHRSFDDILTSAHEEYAHKRIRLRQRTSPAQSNNLPRKRSLAIATRKMPKTGGNVIRVPRRRKCPRHPRRNLQRSDQTAEHQLIDIVFTTNGCRKTFVKYVGNRGYCPLCDATYLPASIHGLQGRLFGHRLQAFAVYQRIVLRLSFRTISKVIRELFAEHVSHESVVGFVKQFAEEYAAAERAILQRILASPVIHVDETRINILGSDQYVWVLTDGRHVVFRLTPTRESTLVEKILVHYDGILISDFYGGYDAMPCRQQKCLVHLIRDLNDDLWQNPYNHSFEAFVASVRDLLVAILGDVERFGLRKRHLAKHKASVERFYKTKIEGVRLECEVTAKFQKRFLRYRDSLFTFLSDDSIPWNNNMAERAIRHLAIQRKISGSFGSKGTERYLRLLGIGQTCRFQNKSFFRFLLSGEKDVEQFQTRKRSHPAPEDESLDDDGP
ncbi:MAG TPA: IS66 family transposase [Planctomycetaceae bacterium]